MTDLTLLMVYELVEACEIASDHFGSKAEAWDKSKHSDADLQAWQEAELRYWFLKDIIQEQADELASSLSADASVVILPKCWDTNCEDPECETHHPDAIDYYEQALDATEEGDINDPDYCEEVKDEQNLDQSMERNQMASEVSG